MPDSMSVKIEGLDVLDKRLVALGAKTAAKPLRKALRPAMKPALKDAKQRAPVGETGNLKKNIAISVRVSGKRGAVADLGCRKKIWYSHFPEKGTSKMSATPFLRPALDNNQDEMVRIFAAELRAQIDSVARGV